MPTLHHLLEGVEPGTASASGNLELIALRRKKESNPSPDYMLATEAFERGVLRVTEVDERGRVPELRAVSQADLPILFLDGEELIGAKQNRILNTDVLMKPRSKKTIPVSCVEQGRWHRARPDFAPGSHAPPPIRASKSSSVTGSLLASDTATSDQGEVWDEVESLLCCMDACSATSSMADAFDQREDDLDALAADLPCPEDSIGVIAVTNGRFAALDLFDRPSTLRRVWSRLVAGYAADAVGRPKPLDSSQPTVDAMDLLDGLRGIECAACSGVDLGEDWRFDSAVAVGSALVAEGTPVHLSAFPARGRARG